MCAVCAGESWELIPRVGRRDPSHPGVSGAALVAAHSVFLAFVKNTNISSEILASQCIPLY